MGDHPRVSVKLGCDRGAACAHHWQKFGAGSYVGRNGVNPKTVTAWLNPGRYGDLDAFLRDARKASKGGIHADLKKSIKAGYRVGPFELPDRIPDIYGEDGIHHSMPERCGKPMKPHYLRTVAEMGGYPRSPVSAVGTPCASHWRQQFGIFTFENGHMNGAIRSSGRLVGYIGLLRLGNILMYSMIIGHGDHLKHGIMGHMHAVIIDRIIRGEPFPGGRSLKGLYGIVYAGMLQGGPGLIHWKKKAQFVPRYMHHD